MHFLTFEANHIVEVLAVMMESLMPLFEAPLVLTVSVLSAGVE